MLVTFYGAHDGTEESSKIVIGKEDMERHGIRNLADVIKYINSSSIKVKDKFLDHEGELRCGCICLVDNEDAEMRKYEEQEVNEGTEIVFMSTLHGG